MRSLRILILIAATAILATAVPAGARTVIADEEPGSSVVVRHVQARDDGVVTGVLVNRSTRLVRDVRLLVRHSWLWSHEFSPGEDSPGRVAYHVVPADIPPAGSVEFRYRPDPPLPDRSDGRFETSVEVVGLTEIGW